MYQPIQSKGRNNDVKKEKPARLGLDNFEKAQCYGLTDDGDQDDDHDDGDGDDDDDDDCDNDNDDNYIDDNNLKFGHSRLELLFISFPIPI